MHSELIQTKAAGSLTRLFAVRHSDGEPHRDPAEERLQRATVIFTTQGTWTFRSTDGAVRLDPGKVLLVNPGETYSCLHESRFPDDRNLSLEISPSLVDEGPTFTKRWVPFAARHGRLLHQMRLEHASAATGARLQIDALASLLLVDALRCGGASDARDQIKAARSFIELNFGSDVRLEDIAGAAALSPFHMAREFKRHTGTTPHRYLTAVRLEHARRLLRGTSQPVTTIAAECGFQSLSNFINTFRRHTGVPPSVYRRNPVTTDPARFRF